MGIGVFSATVIGAGVLAGWGLDCLMIALGILMVLATVISTAKVRMVPKWFRKITDFGNKLLYRKKGEAVSMKKIYQGDVDCCGNLSGQQELG